jgi:5-methylcytosine-specific restriction endonuclease McrA
MADSFDCPHPHQNLRQRVDAAGRPFYQHQCFDCGMSAGPAVATATFLANGSHPPSFDTKLFERGRQECAIARKKLLLMQSDAWRINREKVLILDKSLCQSCRARIATDVHHLTYAHFENEPLFDLVSVCRECHAHIRPDRATAR